MWINQKVYQDGIINFYSKAQKIHIKKLNDDDDNVSSKSKKLQQVEEVKTDWFKPDELLKPRNTNRRNALKKLIKVTSSMKDTEGKYRSFIEDQKVSDYWPFETNQEGTITYFKEDTKQENKPKKKRNRNRSMKSTISSDLKRRDLKNKKYNSFRTSQVSSNRGKLIISSMNSMRQNSKTCNSSRKKNTLISWKKWIFVPKASSLQKKNAKMLK